MLRSHRLVARPSCSKAPRGLFVLSWVTRIFTGTSISPSPLSRQCSSRYSLRAGRNLPDKEFRYLRTVIVTVAVRRSCPRLLPSVPAPGSLSPPGAGRDSAPIHPLARWQRPVFLVNSRLSRFTATLSPSRASQPARASRVPLLPKVRGQFAEFLDRGALVHLGGSPPAYQCRYAVRAAMASGERLF